jgi:hypothetical protein
LFDRPSIGDRPVHEFKLADGRTVEVLEESDLEQWGQRLLGKAFLVLVIAVFGAGAAWASLQARVSTLETRGSEPQQALDRRLYRIELLLESLPDSVVQRMGRPR